MVSVDVRREFPVDAQEVWGWISDFYDLAWLPAVESTRREEARSSRVVVLAGGAGEVVEQLQEQGPRSHRYTVAEPGPMPLRDFHARIRVDALGADRSRIVWTADFEPAGTTAAEAEAVVTGVFTAGLARLAQER